MIEAVNSVISNAPLARAAAVQVATSNSFAADQVAVESVARGPVAPYISPYISVDTNFDTAVLQIRDSDTGDVLTQFPSESTLQQRQRQAARQESEVLNTRPVARTAPQPAETAEVQSGSTVFQATELAQRSSAPGQSGTTAGAAQAAIAALSAGAQSGQAAAAAVSVTA